MEHITLTIICLVIGIALFIVEMFTPGLGIAALLGTVALFVAVLLQLGNPLGIAFMIALVLFLIAVGLFVFMYLVSRGRLDKLSIVLNNRIDGNSTDLKEDNLQAFAGQVGVATTPLRPAGKAEFDGVSLDVATAGEFLPQGTRVKIERVENLRILVHAAGE